jgi:hypothetical protein
MGPSVYTSHKADMLNALTNVASINSMAPQAAAARSALGHTRLRRLLGMPPRLDPYKKQPRKFVLLADMLPRGLAFVLICIAVFCLCLILVGLGG